jgi:DNA-binding beta-propeller fold protein YncE
VEATIELADGTFPTAIAIGPDAVWVGNAGTSTMGRIDPATNAVVVGAIPLRAVPSAMAAGPNDVWIISRAGDVLQRLDPGTNSIAQTIEVGDEPTAVAADGDTCWVGVRSASDHELLHLAHDGTVMSRTDLAGEPTAIVVDGDQVFVTVRLP